ncbi:hypothetical protein GCM10010869_53300 [Mesorhizobium tianshanense]|nr:hypothetical protein GCM10010869_53300 [Mesorhizobium tianshanense]
MKVIPCDPAFDNMALLREGFLLPLDTPPMEARAADAIPEGDEWQYERKWDGFRCLAFGRTTRWSCAQNRASRSDGIFPNSSRH